MEASFPFLFNSLKHHCISIKRYIELAKNNSFDKHQIKTDLLKVGNSMVDIYHGDLSIHQITTEIGSYLKSLDCFEAPQYHNFILGKANYFRTVSLSDGSSWTLINGNDPTRYLHIHPSRYSLHSIRARAIALRTAIYILIFYRKELTNDNLVDLVNQVRINIMGESPVKNNVYIRGVLRVLEILKLDA